MKKKLPTYLSVIAGAFYVEMTVKAKSKQGFLQMFCTFLLLA